MGEHRRVGTEDVALLVLSVDEDGNPIGANDGTPGSTLSDYSRIMSASDLQQAYEYDDVGTADERLISIVSTSATIGKTVTETIFYEGEPGSYRVSSRTRAVA